MDKTLIVAQHELRTTLNRTSYRVMTALVPAALLLLLVGIGVYLSFSGGVDEPERRTVGFVDQAGIITGYHQQGLTTFAEFSNEAGARQAIADGDVERVYVIPPGYMDTGIVSEIVRNESGLDIDGGGNTSALRSFLLSNLVAEVDDDLRAQRILHPVQVTSVPVDGSGDDIADDFDVSRALFFMAIAFAVLVSILTITGFLLQGLNEEKENRVMEILLSTISPDQLMLGKLLGLGLAGIIQMAFWVGSLIAFLFGLSAIAEDFPAFSLPSLPLVIVGAFFFVLGYAFFASLMAALGAVTTSQRESQQITVVVILPAVAPFWFLIGILDNPDGSLARVLTFIPFTAPTMSLARLALDAMQPLEIVASLVVLAVFVFLAVRLTQRLFRVYLLVYGQRPPLRQLVKTILTGRA